MSQWKSSIAVLGVLVSFVPCAPAGAQDVNPLVRERMSVTPGDARGQREVLATVQPQRHARHADAGHERRAQRTAAQLERRRVLEAPLDDLGRHLGQTSSRFSTRRRPPAYCSSTPGLIEYSGMRRCHSRKVTRSSRRARPCSFRRDRSR